MIRARLNGPFTSIICQIVYTPTISGSQFGIAFVHEHHAREFSRSTNGSLHCCTRSSTLNSPLGNAAPAVYTTILGTTKIPNRREPDCPAEKSKGEARSERRLSKRKEMPVSHRWRTDKVDEGSMAWMEEEKHCKVDAEKEGSMSCREPFEGMMMPEWRNGRSIFIWLCVRGCV